MPPRKTYCKKYGELFSTVDPILIELEAISRNGNWINLEGGDCGKGLAFHVKALSQLVWPWVEWHRWNEDLILPELCKVPHTRVAIFGPASASKTFTAAMFVNVMYAARPDNTTVLCSTTTREKLDLGIWADIKKLWREAKKKIAWWPGFLIDSKQQITTDGKGTEGREFRNGLVGRPCRRGSEWVGLSDYAGLKNDYMYLIADECFPAGTLVDTPLGPTPIETIRPGQLVFNASGIGRVKAIASRLSNVLMRISMADGRVVLATENHPFLTQRGWVKCMDIVPKDYVLSPYEAMSCVSKAISARSSLELGLLFARVQAKIGERGVRVVQEAVLSQGQTTQTVLRDKMPQHGHQQQPGEPGEADSRERFASDRQKDQRGGYVQSSRAEEAGRSVARFNKGADGSKADKGLDNSARTWRQSIWQHGQRSCAFGSRICVFESDAEGALQLPHIIRQEAHGRVSALLQDRLRVAENQTGGRGRWGNPHTPEANSPGCSEERNLKGSRVASVEVFQRGRVSSNAKGEGPYRVYNLQVEGNSTYSVNGLCVRNCHLMADGFWKSCANLMSNENFTVCAIGNLNDLSTPLGEAAEPENGWDSIADTTKSRVYTTRWHGGSTVQLIGEDSPNLDYPEGKEPFKKLIGRRFLKQCEHDYGKDTPLYNMFAAGKIPRGTLENRIITRQLCLQFHVFEPVIWGHQPLTKLYGADISYSAEHGDRTVGIPFAFGIDNEGKKRIAPIERPKVYGGDKPKWEKSDIPFEEQLAVDMKVECERLGIPPAHVFFDGTGRSSFTSALMRTWSTAVNAVEFGGTATERPNFLNRRYREGRNRGELLQCRELFGKFVTELWFALRHAIEFDQVRGMSEEVMKEAYFRLWFLTASNKIDAEPKKEMKLRLGRSPDLADSFAVAIEGARRLGFTIGSHETIRPRNTKWLRDLRDQHEAELKSQELVYEA